MLRKRTPRIATMLARPAKGAFAKAGSWFGTRLLGSVRWRTVCWLSVCWLSVCRLSVGWRPVRKGIPALSLIPKLIIPSIALVVFSALPGCKQQSRGKIPTPQLVLLIVADQFPESYFQRFEHLLSGGLASLRNSGVVYTDAKFAHALTNTCPGHASIASGTHPSTHGIVDNEWLDREESAKRYCVQGPGMSLGPQNMRVTSLPDWLKKSYSRAKVYSISGKDRSAITLGGRDADAAIWFNSSSGKFVSSSYYSAGKAWWLDNFNKAGPSDALFGTLWNALEVDDKDLEKAQVQELDRGLFKRGFPHALGGPSIAPDRDFYKDLAASPFVDDLSTSLAKQLILAERLGQDKTPDYLAISYSALDRVGHAYGPNSREVADTLLRLDRNLASLFDFIDTHVGLENVLIAFSSDHGVAPLPEYLAFRGVENKRLTPEGLVCLQQISRKLSKRFGADNFFLNSLYLDYKRLKDLGISRKSFDEQFRQAALSCPMIKQVWSSSELVNPGSETFKFASAFLRSFDAERSPDYLIQFQDNHIPSLGTGTGHGTHYRYDSHVPMILVHPALESQFVLGPAQPIDLAPTISELLGVEVPDFVEGKSWHQVILR